jgi:hypothetical protein
VVAAVGATTVRLRTAVWVKAPDVPVTLTCDVTAAAELPAVNKANAPELTVLKDAVSPAGSPDVDHVTLPANPLSGLKEIAVVPLPPLTMRKLAGAITTAKSAAGVTVTVIVTADVRLPEVPLTVNCDALAAAVLATESVSVLVVVALAGVNDAVTPVGKPVAVKATVPVKAPLGVIVRVAVPVLPAATLTLVAEEERLKLAAAATVKATVACAERAPEVAVMVSVAAPTAAVALAVSFNVVPVNVPVTPVGSPLTARVVAPVKPFSGVTERVLVPEAPCVTLKLAGAAAKVKLGPAFTVRLSVTKVDFAPEVPVTVIVDVPTVAADAALNVATLLVEVEAALNTAVTPLGRPETVRVTLPAKPFLGVTVMVLVALAPCARLSAGVEVETE